MALQVDDFKAAVSSLMSTFAECYAKAKVCLKGNVDTAPKINMLHSKVTIVAPRKSNESCAPLTSKGRPEPEPDDCSMMSLSE